MKKLYTISLITTALIIGGGVSQAKTWQQAYFYQLADNNYSQDEPLLSSESSTNSEPAEQPLHYLPTPGTDDGVQPSGMRFHNEGGIRYISGGVGDGEIRLLKTLSDQFNLRLQFAMHDSGNYLSAVDVQILNAHGETILIAKSEGPWFFAKLEPGEYSVEVNASDQAQQPSKQQVHIDHSQQHRLNFYW